MLLIFIFWLKNIVLMESYRRCGIFFVSSVLPMVFVLTVDAFHLAVAKYWNSCYYFYQAQGYLKSVRKIGRHTVCRIIGVGSFYRLCILSVRRKFIFFFRHHHCSPSPPADVRVWLSFLYISFTMHFTLLI